MSGNYGLVPDVAQGFGSRRQWSSMDVKDWKLPNSAKLFTLLIQKFVANFGTLSLQFLSEHCSTY
jgi:hypothetical protein